MAALSRAGLNVGRQIVCRAFSSTPKTLGSQSHVDEKTHTGQVWERGDYRRVRFVDKDKMVNEQFAVNLIAEDPVVVVEARNVWSDSGGALGHPKVYINLDKNEFGVCGYSGRKFIQKKFYDPAKHGPSITYAEYLAQVQPSSD
ncbi:NADH dehydrogenase [ubiquinone] iron-sulfur protein 6, mitochondrial-like [Haliotis rufescens]|uniref:NADH dehydrogenase [ubiquinone] iron-sulfur protein 6, mitochondrial-like n=1 Tax=Haliotis rufescens TaxID=6454 RepID=UPI001EAF8ECF|nr:NADH dehydrogenase [ubiquinone] iron-sulfur protein 6, mitochondrial-like [Haliotis rufescens]